MGEQRTVVQPPRVPNANNRLQTGTLRSMADPCTLFVAASGYDEQDAMLTFMRRQWRSWYVLTGQRSHSGQPSRSEHTRVQIRFSLDIEADERHYIECLARWIALRVGKRKRYPKLGIREPHPAVYYDTPQDAWLVLSSWDGEVEPEACGVGSVCDQDGFLSRVAAWDRTALRLDQDTCGASEGLRQKRVTIVSLEGVVKDELSRLSALWAM